MSEERLARIEALLEHLTEKFEDQAEQTNRWRSRTDLTLHGDGNGHRGLIVRIDRLEQAQCQTQKAHDRHRKLLVTVIGAIVVLILQTAWQHFTSATP